MRDNQQKTSAVTAAKRAETPAGVKRLRSTELLAGAGEIRIEHEGREYRLRVTRNGKLILTA